MEAQGRLWEKTAINENKHRATVFVSGSMRFLSLDLYFK